MEVQHYSDSGYNYKEIRSRVYQELVALGNEYMKRGARIWINAFDECDGVWMLTVREAKAA